MGLQRYSVILGYPPAARQSDVYNAADVDALLARIRAAVGEERGARETVADAAVGWELMQPAVAGYREARAALDALLSEEVGDV